MLLRSFEPPNLPFPASMLSIRTASMPFTCCFEASNLPIFHSRPKCYLLRIASMPCICCFKASNHPIFHSRPVCYLYVLPICNVHAVSKLRTTQSSIPGQYAIYTYSSMPFTCCFEASNHPIFHSRPVCYLYVLQYAMYMLLRSFEPPNLPFPASMLSIRTPVCHLHAASKLRTTQSSIPGQYAIYTYSSMPCTCSLEASNHPILHSQPVCYRYVSPVCHLHAASKLRTTQSSIPGKYAIYTYCQCAMYMLLRSFEPPNLPFLASMLSIRTPVCHLHAASKLRTTQSSIPGRMLSIRTASMPCTCCFEASNQTIFHSQPVCYLYVLPMCHVTYDVHAASKLRTTKSSIPSQYAIYTYSSMPFTCCFEASNHPIFHSRPVCYLYVLPVCHVHAASKLRTKQSSIPSQYAIYTYCQCAMLRMMYMLLRSFEPPNLPFPASMLSIRIASMPCTCCFEASNHPLLHSRPVCYLYVLQYAIYMLLRSFEPPNLPFPASMLSICTASMPFTCCFEASNLPIFHSRPKCYLYVLPVCHLHAASKLRTTQSSIPGQYAIYTYCQYAMYMLLRSFEPTNLPFPASMLSIRTPVCHLHAASKLRTTQSSIPGQYAIYTYSSMPCTCSLEASNHPIFHSRPVCYLYVLQYAIYMLLRSFEPPNLPFPASMLSIRTPVCHLHAASKLRTTQSYIPGRNAIYTYSSIPVTCCFVASNHPILHSWPVCYLYIINRLMRYILKGQRQPIPSSSMMNWGWSQKPLMWTLGSPKLCLSNSPSLL